MALTPSSLPTSVETVRPNVIVVMAGYGDGMGTRDGTCRGRADESVARPATLH